MPHTNLLLVIVRTDRSSCYDKMDVSPFEIFPYKMDGNVTEPPCHKLPLNGLFRRKLEHCYTHHEHEDEIEACGGSAAIAVSILLLTTAALGPALRLV